MLRLQVELAQMKQDFERRVSEKEEELDNQRYIELDICSPVCGSFESTQFKRSPTKRWTIIALYPKLFDNYYYY